MDNSKLYINVYHFLFRALRFERIFIDVTLTVNSAQAPLRHPEGSA